MYFYLGAFLALSTLGGLVLPAPVPETQPTLDIKDMEVPRNPEFLDAAESALSLITKILSEIPAVHKSMIHIMTLRLDGSNLNELQHLKDSLDLPEPHNLSDKLNLESSLSRMVEGLKLHKTLLKVIAELPHLKSKKPSELPYDLRDALLHLHKMQHMIKAVKTPEMVSESQLKEDLARKVKTDYMSQVAAHLTLLQLRDFAEDVSRSLQSWIKSAQET